jgi:hypothetical protein
MTIKGSFDIDFEKIITQYENIFLSCINITLLFNAVSEMSTSSPDAIGIRCIFCWAVSK